MPKLWHNVVLSVLLGMLGILGVWAAFRLEESQNEHQIGERTRQQASFLQRHIADRLGQTQAGLSLYFRSHPVPSSTVEADIDHLRRGFPALENLCWLGGGRPVPPGLEEIHPRLGRFRGAPPETSAFTFPIDTERTGLALLFRIQTPFSAASLGLATLSLDNLMEGLPGLQSGQTALKLTDDQGRVFWISRTLPRDPIEAPFHIRAANVSWSGSLLADSSRRDMSQAVYSVILVMLVCMIGLSFIWRGHYRQEQFERANALMEARNRELAALNETITAASQTLDLNVVLQVALQKALNAVHAVMGTILLLEPESRELKHVASLGFTSEEIKELGNVRVGEGVTGQAAARRETIVVPDALSDRRAESPRLLRQAKGIGVRTIVSVPLVSKEHVMGVLNVVDKHPRYFAAESISLLNAMGRHLGVIIENARLYEREHRIADVLQRSFLPPMPDRYEGFEFAQRYRTALNESLICGDICDVFPLPDGNLVVVIADVSGSGLQSALQTNIVRYAIRAYTLRNTNPVDVLKNVNALLCSPMLNWVQDAAHRQNGSGFREGFVTVFLGIIDPKTRLMRYANAGHQPPILYRFGRQEAEFLKVTGTVVGAFGDTQYGAQECFLNACDALLLYTDGLVEKQGQDIAKTTGELAEFFARIAACDHPLSDIADCLYEGALELASVPGDDISLLLVRDGEGTESV
ncbi:MAG: SpoIIE family protein phosphatase [Armatimonadetes bacterium]|nr:SpoIIE family protein phosphatase [Armatimonadota bacterium]